MSTAPFNRALFETRLARAKLREYDDFLMRKMLEELEERVYFADAATDNRAIITGETPVFTQNYDLIASLNDMQMMNDIQAFLSRVKKALNPNGFFIAGFVGGESLNELHYALATAEGEITGGVSPHIHPFIDVKTAGSLLQHAGFKLPVVDSDRLTIRYSSFFSLIKELNQSGYNNILNSRLKHFMRRDVITKASEIYADKFSDADGRVRATLEILWLTGRKQLD
jgi:SAM-dependent methyltransferase